MNHFKIQLMIIFICSAAAWLGPMLFIRTEPNYLYLLAGLFLSFIFVLIYTLILEMEKLLQRFCNSLRVMYGIGFVTGAAPITYLIASGYINLDFAYFFAVNRGIALLNPIFIFLLMLFLFVYHLIRLKDVFRAIYETSLFYALPVASLFVGFYFFSTGESEVLFGNVGLLYFLLAGILLRTKLKFQEK
ncbi:hypothetical protein [Paenibacillus turpanensis]|uniref:hypothetical protein n=1 Tax=Paenibacillus turpanensis TaxID=2689078 RepID=UPI00140AFAEF|nr:hypothetical protein [Paenibacillus turpanensis]